MEKPEVLKPIAENIPEFLKDQPNWVVWKLKKRGGKWTKPPFDPKTGKSAKVNKPATWTDFKTAMVVYAVHQQTGKYDGIGFMLTDAMKLVGFDFDHCRHDGVVDDKVLGFIDTLSTYAEISPSGDGLRALAFGELPEGRRKAGPFEVYDTGRYLTITGHRLEGSPNTIEHRGGEVLDVYRAIFGADPEGKPEKPSGDPAPSREAPESDQDLLERAFNSKNGDTIRALYRGDWEGAYKSQSEADMALCGHLAFWFRKNAADMDRVFRSSGLMRGKWDEKRGKETYGRWTIRMAIKSTNNVYEWGPLGSEGREKPADGEESEMERWKKRLNKKHAVVMVGGKVLVLNEIIDPTFNRPDFSLSTFEDFKKWYSNRKALNKKTGRMRNVAADWLEAEDRTQYQGIVFSPQKKVPDYYNLWKGLSIEPKPGDWNLLRRHIWECIVDENEEYFRWLIAWFARILQDPGGDRPGTAVVLKGPHGGGKGVLVNQFQGILGPHFLAVSNQTHITGRFNSHHKNALMLFCDEGVWAGSKSDQGVLKQLITEPRIMVEAKNKDAVIIDNHLNLIIASNERWVVPADPGERRYFVLKVSGKHKGEGKYFDAIWEQMNNGGREAMAYDLIHNVDVKEVNLRKAPKTPALLEQTESSMTPVQLWWYERLKDGENNPKVSEYWEEQVECVSIQNDFDEFFLRLGRRSIKPSQHQFGTQLRELCPGLERRKSSTFSNTVSGRQRPWVYRFPDLETCRKAFDNVLCMECPWE